MISFYTSHINIFIMAALLLLHVAAIYNATVNLCINGKYFYSYYVF